jgi:preprotein translocase subunit SecG
MNNVLLTVILAVQMLAALGMIGLILIQHGKGADMGAAFGSGSSGSLFGASGSANFLSRTTAVLAAVFFVCTLALAYFGNLRPVESGSVLERAATTTTTPAPAPAPAASGAAAQIPGTAAPAPASTTTAPAAPAASGAGQIPVK